MGSSTPARPATVTPGPAHPASAAERRLTTVLTRTRHRGARRVPRHPRAAPNRPRRYPAARCPRWGHSTLGAAPRRARAGLVHVPEGAPVVRGWARWGPRARGETETAVRPLRARR